MIPPDVYDAAGKPYHGEERRSVLPRREEDMRDDALDPAVLLGYEAWAGRMWRHRGKLAAAIGFLGSVVGCAAGYLGRAHDLDDVRTRLSRVEEAQAALQQTEPLKMSMLCSLTRRIDPLGVPADCNNGSIPTVRP